jgi:hypothetical protein
VLTSPSSRTSGLAWRHGGGGRRCGSGSRHGGSCYHGSHCGQYCGHYLRLHGLAGAVLSTVGAIQSGQQAKATAEYNSDVARMQALDARRRGSQAEGEHRQRVQQFMGAQRAQMGGSGAVVDQGSFGDVLAQTAEFGERDAQRLRSNAERQAWGLQSEAEGSMYQGRAAQTAGYYKAGSSVLSYAASPAGSSLLGGDMAFFRPKPYYDSWRN